MLRAVPVTRMVDYGAPAADAERFAAAVSAGEEWVSVGVDLAAGHRRDALASDAAGLPSVAQHHHGAATALELLAQLGLGSDDSARRGIYQRAAADLLRSAGGWQRLTARRDGRYTVCWLSATDVMRPTTVVLIWGGTTGWGPVYARMAAQLAALGVAIALVELPGQGLARLIHGSVLDAEYIGAVDALLDVLAARLGPGTHFALYGNSVGGLLAARAAAALPRVAATIVNGGMARPADTLRRYPRQRGAWAAMTGLSDEAELVEFLQSFAFDSREERIERPVLILHGVADPLVTTADVGAFAASVQPGADSSSLIVRMPDGEHCLYNRAGERDAFVAAWLRAVLLPGST